MIAVGEKEEEEAIRIEDPLQIVLRIVLGLIKASDFSFANTERSKNVGEWLEKHRTLYCDISVRGRKMRHVEIETRRLRRRCNLAEAGKTKEVQNQ